MAHTTWVSKTDLHTSFRNILESLENKYEAIHGLLTEDLYPIQKDTYHFLAQVIRSGTREEHALLSHILNIAYRAEVLSQGAGPMAFLFTVGYAKYLYQNSLLDNPHFFAFLADPALSGVEQTLQALRKGSNPGIQKYLEEGIDQICQQDFVLAQAAKEAIYLSGLEGKLFVENGTQSNFLVEQKTGYVFVCKPYKFFLNAQGTWSGSNCKVLVVDGLLEKVSEIDGLLQKCHETKQKMIIVASGFSEEVVATLRVNQERNNFECLPVRIMPDIESLNMVNDISVVCGTLPVSSHKGDLVCFVKFENLPTVEHIELRLGDMNIRNPSTVQAVSGQVQSLMEKRSDNYAIEDVQNLIDNRLKSLVSTAVVVHLPDTSRALVDERRVHLDNCFRFAKSVINHGVLSNADFLRELGAGSTHEERALRAAFEYALQKRAWSPALSVLIAFQTGLSGLSTILGSGGMVKIT